MKILYIFHRSRPESKISLSVTLLSALHSVREVNALGYYHFHGINNEIVSIIPFTIGEETFTTSTLSSLTNYDSMTNTIYVILIRKDKVLFRCAPSRT